MAEKLLTFEWDDGKEVLKVHANREGIDYLIDVLTRLRELPPPDHAHLMTEEWGGSELTSEKQDQDALLVNHVKLYTW